MKTANIPAIVLVTASAAMLAACASSSSSSHGPSKSAARGDGEGYYKVGKPYQVGGNWYSPEENYSYDETGIASWYGQDFHGAMTSNGEIFNKNELTAAHKTLPLPTLARVTNLDNGRSIVVRINDRGPFSGARLIDVSQRAAQLLGFEQTGTAKVRVQVLADESKAIADAMRHYGGGAQTAAPVAVAENMPENIAGGTIPPQDLASAAAASPLPVIEAPASPVAVEPVSSSAVEVKNLEPITTTPAIHAQLLRTAPVPQVVQLPVAASPSHIFVQAGAFTILENAAKMKDTLSSYGPVTVSDIVVNGTTFHRVRVGPVASVAQADQLLARLRKAGITNLRTTVD